MRWPWSRRRAAPAAAAPADAPTPPPEPEPAPEPTAKAVPAGIGGFQPRAAAPPSTDPAGSDGVSIVGGFIVAGERDHRLTGNQKWITYDNQVLNVAVIGAAVNVWTRLGGSAKWVAEPNPRGGDAARVAAELVTEGVLEAPMETPWPQVVRRQLMKVFRGFALHEMTIRRRSDDVIVLAGLQDRPQWTVWRWNRPDERMPWVGIEQQTMTGGGPYYIERPRLFYSVENTLTASPEGVGLLRLVAESCRVLELYGKWEGIGFQTDLRGVPSARAPLAKLREQAKAAGAKTDPEINAYIKAQTQFLEDFLFGHNKTAEQGVMLDSATYLSKDATQSPSSVYQWAFDLIRGSTSGMPEVGTAIGRIVRDIARVMCAEWLLLGGEDSGGAYSMHADKTAMFGLVVNSALNDIAADATRDIAARLVRLNGLDPETCTPRLVPEPVAAGAVKDACQALALLAQAALDPRDKAINVLRSRLDLPPAPEIDDAAMMLQDGGGTEPDPSGGEAGAPGAGPADVPPDAAKRVTKYDPEQGRDPHGRWSGSGSADERIAMALVNSVGRRTPEHDAEVERQERAAIDNEDAAIAAGHLHEPPHAKLDAYGPARAAALERVGAIRGELDAHHAAAAQALADLHARDSGERLSEAGGLAEDHFEATSWQLGALRGDSDKPSFVRESDHEHDPVGEAPEPPNHPGAGAHPEDLADYEEQLAGHRVELAEHQAAAAAAAQGFAAHAETTQTALEALHAQQVKASAEIKATDKVHERAARAARDEVNVDPNDLVDRSAIGTPHEDRARSAADTRLGYESMRRDELTSLSFEDAHDTLADSTRQTARAVRELARITGRAPKLAGGKAQP